MECRSPRSSGWVPSPSPNISASAPRSRRKTPSHRSPRHRRHRKGKYPQRRNPEVYTMRDIDERGMRTVMEEALRPPDAAPPAITSRSTWTGSTPKTHRRRHARTRRSHLPRSPSSHGDHRRPWPHAQLRNRRGEPRNRRTQPHGRFSSGTDFLSLREENLINEKTPHRRPLRRPQRRA